MMGLITGIKSFIHKCYVKMEGEEKLMRTRKKRGWGGWRGGGGLLANGQQLVGCARLQSLRCDDSCWQVLKESYVCRGNQVNTQTHILSHPIPSSQINPVCLLPTVSRSGGQQVRGSAGQMKLDMVLFHCPLLCLTLTGWLGHFEMPCKCVSCIKDTLQNLKHNKCVAFNNI